MTRWLLACVLLMSAVACSSPGGPGEETGDAATPTPEPTPSELRGRGGANLDACTLLKADEVARVTGLRNVDVAASAPGDPALCIFGNAEGVQAAMVTYAQANAAADFQALAQGTDNVSGIGEKAYWQPNGETLSVLKNGKVVQISAAAGLGKDLTPGRRLDQAKQLATIAAARQ